MGHNSFNLRRFFTLSGVALTVFLCAVIGMLGSDYLKVVAADESADALRPQVQDLNDLRYDIVQIQQYITDVAATRLDDGFDDARLHYDSAVRQINALRTLNPSLKPELDDIRAVLDATYGTGVRMASAYLQGDTRAGNQLMKDPTNGFDWLSSVLIRRTEALRSQMSQASNAMELNLHHSIERLGQYNLLMYGILLLGVLAFFWRTYQQLVVIIGDEPVKAQQLLSQLARAGNLDTSDGLLNAVQSGSRSHMDTQPVTTDIVALTASIDTLIKDRERALQVARQAKTDAEAANRAKSAFLANMSHEIRTPMNGVIGMTDLTLRTELTTTQRHYLSMVRNSADSLMTIINDILDFSKIEAGKMTLEDTPFSLRTCIRQTLETLSTRASEQQLQLICRISDSVHDELLGDPVRLRQVLTNLLTNAIKFSQHGDILLEVSTQDNQLQFIVEDHGIGIPADKLHTIFESFAQADNSTTRRYGGTGLGLTICKQLVELMGGRIWVTSEPGVGSKFSFTIRYVPSELPVAEPVPRVPASAVTPILAGQHVLIIEDQPADQHWLSELLQRWGMPTRVASDLATARAQLASSPPDVVLLDLNLPDGSGFDMLTHLRQHYPRLIILIVTAVGSPSDEQRAMEMGAQGFLHKPVSASQLQEALLPLMSTVTTSSTPVINSDSDTPSLHILVAEDNAVNQLLAQALLEQLGHTVTVVDNGAKAVTAVREQPFDLVLMDMHMPELNGLQATEQIRQHEQALGHARLPIVALTANAMTDAIDSCFAAGMDGYVSKPIKLERLTAEISRCLTPSTAPSSAPGLPLGATVGMA